MILFKELFYYFCSIVFITLFLATTTAEDDPYKIPIHIDCPPYKTKEPFKYPPPIENPKIDITHTYPSAPPGIYYPPLLGNISVVVQYDYHLGSWVGSPSLLKLNESVWLASADVKTISNVNAANAWVTQIYASMDQGKTWKKTASISNLTWGSLFTAKGKVYILGAADLNTKIRISRMESLHEWTQPFVIVDQLEQVHTGNVGVLVTKDKVQTSIKNGRHQDVCVIYAFIQKDDLMKPWRVSNLVRDPLRDNKSTMKDYFNIQYTLSEEGVMVPYGNKHAQVILRVNNEELCGLSERYLWDLETNKLSFLRLSVDPGWSSSHGFVIYDSVSDFYWMVSQYHRDAARDVYQLPLYVPTVRTCQADRSILGLYYNKHLSDAWHLAGFVSYSPDFAHHASYPFLVLDGDDLVFVARSHLGGPFNETTVNNGKRICQVFTDEAVTANNHNSNMVIFNRITNFRQYIHPMMWYGQRSDNPWDV